jgi:hypothetical protein
LKLSQIENDARQTAGCSEGDPLLAEDESLLQVMVEDNDLVQKAGLTHQQLAAPLYLAYAMYDKDLGTEFYMHGFKYLVEFGSIPKCGGLTSPFGDDIETVVIFPKVTNTYTGKSLQFSGLHPYLIDQYGFYGSHKNGSYMSPEKILEVFDFLKPKSTGN